MPELFLHALRIAKQVFFATTNFLPLLHFRGPYMDRAMKSMLCRLLIALMIWTPYSMAQAGMIGTDQVGSSSANQERAALAGMLSRSDMASQLQLLGIDPAQAKDRVQAMSDQEVATLTQRIGALPAGAMSDGAALLLIILIAAGVWWYLSDRRR